MRRRKRLLLLLLLREDDASTERQEPACWGPRGAATAEGWAPQGNGNAYGSEPGAENGCIGALVTAWAGGRAPDIRTVGTSRRSASILMTEVLRFLPLPLPAARQSAAAGRDRTPFFNGLPEKLNLVIYSYPYA